MEVKKKLKEFLNFSFFRPIKTCIKFEERAIKYIFYRGKCKNCIIFFPGIPNNPKEEYISSFSSFGNIILIDNKNFIEIILDPREIEKFMNNIQKIIEKYKAETVILSSFSTIFLNYVTRLKNVKKIILFSPILKFGSNLKNILLKDIERVISLNKEEKDKFNKNFVNDFINFSKENIKKSYKTIKRSSKKF